MPFARGLFLAAAIALFSQASLTAGGTQSPPPAGRPRVVQQDALIDVPYLAQTPALCGGAAVAMVLRYWGDRDVLPRDFQALVDRKAGGIATNVLATAVTRAGWVALTSHDQTDAISAAAEQIALGRPVIALLDAGARSYHYVVIVGLTATSVVFHDPARSASRVLSRQAFDRAWAATDRWSMTILPDGRRPSARPLAPAADAALDDERPAASTRQCSALIEAAVERARGGNADEAESQLRDAARLCPTASAPWRELAGLRFQQSRWAEARDLAATAVSRDAADGHAQQLLAASRFMLGDELGALAGWNRLKEPRTDIISVRGNADTPAPAVLRLLNLEPRDVLSTGAFLRAERRLAELPAAATTRLRYVPISSGRVTVQASIAEQARYPNGWLALGELGARAILTDQVEGRFANALHAGDEWTATGRWSDTRPMIAGTLAIPAPTPLPGVLAMNVSWERQTYVMPGQSAAIVQSRRQVGVQVADWATGHLRWILGGAMDRLDGHAHLRLDAAVDRRLWRDHLSLRGATNWWSPSRAAEGRLWSARTSASWRSTTERFAPTLRAGAEWLFVSDAAPLALWPGAGTGKGRENLLRAHPLLESDVVIGPAFGRTLAHGTVEYAHPVLTRAAARMSIAGFADAAQARRGVGDHSPVLVDVGAGLRIGAPAWNGVIRVDIARGLQDGRMAFSTGWTLAWPW